MRQRIHGRSTRTGLIAALVGIALVGVTACSSDDSGDASSDPPAEESASDAQGSGGTSDEFDGSFSLVVKQGEEALGGSEITLDSVVGQGTPVVFNLYAALCPPCRVEMPWFQTAVDEYGDDVLMIGVDVGPFTNLGSVEQGRELLKELEITYAATYAVDGEWIRQLNPFGMPHTTAFDGDGEVLLQHAGMLTEQQIQDMFAELAAGAK